MTLVSVVIPCRNYGRFVGEAIESALAQTHEEVEVIVVDYGSTDDTADVVARYPQVRCLPRPNRGLGAARNDGLATSRGTFVVFLDADDRLVPDAVSTSVACLQARPECAFAYGHMSWFDANGPVSQRGPGPHGCLDQDPYRFMLRTNNHLRGSGAVLYRRDPLERIGGFDRGVDVADDLDLHLRLARAYPICCNDRVVLLTRVHHTSLSTEYGDMLAKAVAAQQRQRAFVAEHPVYKRDYEAGLRWARSYWGGQLVEQIITEAASRNFRAALRDLRTLGRYHPRGSARLMRRLIARGSLRLRR